MNLKTGIMMLLIGMAMLGLAASSVSGFTAICLSGGCSQGGGYGDDCSWYSGGDSGCADHIISGGYWHWQISNNWCENHNGWNWYVNW